MVSISFFAIFLILRAASSIRYTYDISYANSLAYEIQCTMSRSWGPIGVVAEAFKNGFAVPLTAGLDAPNHMDDNVTMQLLYSIIRPSTTFFSNLYVGFENGKFIGYSRSYNYNKPYSPTLTYLKNSNSSCEEFEPPYNFSSHCLRVYYNSTKQSTGLIDGKASITFQYYAQKRPWYLGVKENNADSQWSELYAFVPSGGLGMSAAKQLLTNNGEFIGVVGIDLHVNPTLQLVLSDEDQSNSVFVSFIVDANFFLVASSNTSYDLKQKVLAVDSPESVVSSAARHFQSLKLDYGNSSIQLFASGKELYWASSIDIGDKHGLAWHVVTAQRIQCPSKYYANSDGDCVACHEKRYSDGGTSIACDKCTTNYFMSKDGECESCTEGMKCERTGVTIQNVEIENHYYRFSETATKVYRCPFPDHCLGSIGNMTNATADEYNSCKDGTTGPLCVMCERYFHFSLDDEKCTPCDAYSPTSAAIVLYIIIGLILLLVASFLLNIMCHSESAIYRLKTKCGDISSKALNLVQGPKWQRVRSKIRILYVFYQLVSGFGGIIMQADKSYPKSFRNAVEFFSFVNFDFWSALPFDCIFYENDYFDSVLLSTLTPIIICILLLVMHFQSNAGPSMTTVLVHRNVTYFQAFLLVLFIVLPSCSSKIFATFVCDSFDINGDDGTANFLQSDYAIDCDSQRYSILLSYSIVMIIIYPIGVPCLFAVLLWHDRHELMDPIVLHYIEDQTKAPQPHDLQRPRSSTLMDYANEGFKVTVRAPKTIFYFLFGKATLGKMGGQDEISRNEWDKIAYNHRLSFLLSSYGRRVYWYEVIETLRRISLSGLLVIFRAGSVKQITIGCIFSSFYLRVDTFYVPRKDDGPNILAEICGWQRKCVIIHYFSTRNV